MIKERMAREGHRDASSLEGNGESGKAVKLSATQHLFAASISGGATAMLTNPIWVVKTRMFATPPKGRGSVSTLPPSSPASGSSTTGLNGVRAYRGLWDGLRTIYLEEGIRGLYKGAGLALVGVSNGAIQFTAYEQLKKWRSLVAVRSQGGTYDDVPEGGVKLTNTEYIVMSGTAKMVAIFLTYPYQVVRSRIQNNATAHLYPSIPACIRRTYREEGGRAFYKGLTANTVRIIPGTCVTFVVYEQIAWALRGAAERRRDRALEADSNDSRRAIVRSIIEKAA